MNVVFPEQKDLESLRDTAKQIGNLKYWRYEEECTLFRKIIKR